MRIFLHHALVSIELLSVGQELMLMVWQVLVKAVKLNNTEDGIKNVSFGEDINLLASEQYLQLTGLRRESSL